MTFSLAVFGNPIAHSLSPQIHQQFAQQTGIELTYEKVRVESDEFTHRVEDFFARGGKGLNVTVPHKSLAYELAGELSAEAKAAQAVNTLFLSETGNLRGENTDGWGLLSDIENNLRWSVKDKKVLLLGAGGAAQGVLRNLLDRHPKELIIANRTFERALDLVNRFGDQRLRACTMNELSELGAVDIILSASSGGLDDSEINQPFLPAELRTATTCCYDMIYGKPTRFLQWAAEVVPKEQRQDGLGMLIEQAARSFQLWFDVEVDTQNVLTQLRASL